MTFNGLGYLDRVHKIVNRSEITGNIRNLDELDVEIVASKIDLYGFRANPDRQAGQEELYLDVSHGVPAIQPKGGGVDLSNYKFEVTLTGAAGKTIQLFLKGYRLDERKNCYQYDQHGETLAFDPKMDISDTGEPCQNIDLAHVAALGVKIREGIGKTKVLHAELVRRSNSAAGSLKTGGL